MFEEIDQETIDLFQQLADGREKCPLIKEDVSKAFLLLPKYICPNLVGEDFDYIRKSTLLMMVSQRDVSHNRTRLHQLLVGAPGSGKSAFSLDWNENYQGVFINGEHASKAGLCGDARGSGSPGLLTTYTNNIVVIDEIDKMDSKDMNALLQAMGEGQYTIVKGSIHKTYPAEVRVIATANSIKKIISPLRDRFDFVYYMTTPSRKERADTVPQMVNSFFGEIENKKTATIKLYLKWIQDYHPKLVEEDLKVIYQFMQTYITDTHTNIDEISRRNLECSILRIAYALAKLERKDISKNHVKQAILFKDKILSKYKLGFGDK